jgi:hypothetical protein
MIFAKNSSEPLSPNTRSGRRRGRPRSPAIVGLHLSGRVLVASRYDLVLVSWIASGMARPSQITWRLLPRFARSVGLRPICCPQEGHTPSCCPLQPATNQSVRGVPASQAKRSGSVARCPTVASHVPHLQQLIPEPHPVPVAASPKECR